MISFADYLVNHSRITDNPAGDFIADARDEIKKGRFAKGNALSNIVSHVCLRSGNAAAMKAAEVVYRRYESWSRRHTP